MSSDRDTSETPSSRVSRSTLANRSLVALLWSGLDSWGGQLISLCVYMILARLLGPAEFGLIAMAGVYIAFIQIFVNSGLTVALVQRPEVHNTHLNAAFWFSFLIGGALAIASWFLAESAAAIYSEPRLVPVLRALSLALVFASVSGVPMALMRRKLLYKPLALRTLVATLVGGSIAIVLAFNGFGVWSLVAQQLVSGFVKLILLWLQTKWRPEFGFSGSALKELLPFSLSILGNNMVEFGNRQGDKFIVGLILGPAALGYYVLGYRLYRTMNMLLTGFVSRVSISSFSALQNDIEKLRSTYLTLTRIAASVAFPTFASAAALAPVFIPLLLGDKWGLSIPVFQVFCLVGALESVSFFNASVMISMGKPHWKFGLGLINLSLNTVGFLIVAKFGIVYVAVLYTARAYLVSPLPLLLVKRLTGLRISEYLSGLLVAAIASLALHVLLIQFPCIDLLSSNPWMLIVSAGFVGLVMYSVTLFIFDKKLMASLMQIYKKIRRKKPIKADDEK